MGSLRALAYRDHVLIPLVALDPVPRWAVVDHDCVARVVERVTQENDAQALLEAAFARLERRHPALAELLGAELDVAESPSARTLSYFLFLIVFMSFEEAFGSRLDGIDDDDLRRARDQLLTDGELRAAGPLESYSEDAIALGQPAVMRLVHGEITRMLDGHETRAPFDVEPIVRLLLVEVLALSASVAPH